MIRQGFFLFLALAAGAAAAQQYRWIDRDGRVQFGDAPPAGARDVRKADIPAPAKPAAPQVPYELARLQKDYPVTLFTSPSCKEGCTQARDALNKRGVPFKEVQVWDPDTNAELKKATGADEVPAIVVGRSMQRGYEPGAFDALLDSAGYPKAGILPPLAVKPPAPPEGYVMPADVQAKPVVPNPNAAPAPKAGPYDTSGLPATPVKPGIYDASGLPATPVKPGQYGLPGETK